MSDKLYTIKDYVCKYTYELFCNNVIKLISEYYELNWVDELPQFSK